jgi:ADP-heptose:LPS heptosyltransferase
VTFRPELVGGCEQAKIAAIVVPYLQGRSLDIGSGPGKLWPSMIGIDTRTEGGRPVTDMCLDATDLSIFDDDSVDNVFSSFLLHLIEWERVKATLLDWTRLIRPDGHFVLYLPIYPLEMQEEHPDPAEKWWVRTTAMECLFDDVIPGWERIIDEERQDGDEYAHLWVFKRPGVIKGKLWERNPDGQKRALVIRYGAIGDAFVAASVLPGLKQQGYHITFMCHPATKEVLLHDPNIDEWNVQAKDFVPNEVLGPYWMELSKRYDRVVNLCESVEGLLLALPGRINHAYSDDARRALYDHVNYLEHTHDIAAVPHEFAAVYHMTAQEREKAKWDRRKMNGPVVVWCVNGSSPHKVYPWTHIVVGWLLERTPAHIVLYGDSGPLGSGLVEGIADVMRKNNRDMDRLHPIGGAWPLRRALAFAHVVDCVIGPETGPLNAVGLADVRKIIYLSHSSPDNLTKHWRHTVVLTPDRERAPCWPCHRLHSNWDYCPQNERTNAAVCASAIAPERVFEAIAEAIGARRIAA